MKKLFTIFALMFILLPFAAMAQGSGGNPGNGSGGNPAVDVKVTLENPFNVGNDLYTVAKGIVNNVLLPIGGILCVLGFIYAGFSYVTAGGEPAKIKTAHNMLLGSAIGTALILGAWVLIEVAQTTIGGLLS